MNIHKRFDEIIQKCLIEIQDSINECNAQIENTCQQITKIESAQQATNNTELLRIAIQKNNFLLVDNFCLIDKQTRLIKNYYTLIQLMNKKFSNPIINDDAFNDLLEYYKEHQRFDVYEIIQSFQQNNDTNS